MSNGYHEYFSNEINFIRNEDGTFKHITKEGSRFHVIYYDTFGPHCSEPNCEFNKKKEV